ncbi:hypothetical protein ACOSQ4_021794 [Xanthoceras sorbifolium]
MLTCSKLGIFKPKIYHVDAPHSLTEPQTVLEALQDPNWKAAMVDEYQAFIRNNTWSLVSPPSDVNIVGNKWVFRVKHNADGSVQRFKARLVAKGFHQIVGLDYFQTYSPVVKSATIRVVLSLAFSLNWCIEQLDVNNAFLNGDLHETVFMAQPKGFIAPQLVCKLHKSLYWLKQAPRAWYEKLKSALLKWGFVNSKADSSLFILHTSLDIILLLVYVDDILMTGSSRDIDQVIQNLGATFALKTLGSLSYFLGFEIARTAAGLHVSQTKYAIDLFKRTNMLHSKPCPTPMVFGIKLTQSAGEKFFDASLYRSTIGALQYLTISRPDIAYAVNNLSQYLSAHTTSHWLACKRVLRYINGTLYCGLFFRPSPQISLTVFTDADWGSCLDDRKSTSGLCVFLGQNLVTWGARKQKVVARSSTEAEYRALAQAATEVIWFQSLFSELKLSLHGVPIIWCDNTSATSLAHNPVYHARTKHIELDLHFLRDKIAAHVFEVRFVPSKEQLADIFTKPLPTARFDKLKSKLILDKSKLTLRGDVGSYSRSGVVIDDSNSGSVANCSGSGSAMNTAANFSVVNNSGNISSAVNNSGVKCSAVHSVANSSSTASSTNFDPG